MAAWTNKKGKAVRGPSGAKRKKQVWRMVNPDGTASDWQKGKPC